MGFYIRDAILLSKRGAYERKEKIVEKDEQHEREKSPDSSKKKIARGPEADV